MDGRSIAALYELTHRVIGTNLAGLTHEDSVIHPRGGGSSINWILGHLMVSRDSMLKLVGEEPIWAEKRSKIYMRGAGLPADQAAYARLEDIRAALQESMDRLQPRMRALAAEAGVVPGLEGSILSKLLFSQFHEAYHVGQIGILRRSIGKEGAIR